MQVLGGRVLAFSEFLVNVASNQFFFFLFCEFLEAGY